jgi:hypothetical protein
MRGWCQASAKVLGARAAELPGRIEAAAVVLFGEGSPGALDVTLASAFSLAGTLFLILYLVRFLRENGGGAETSAAAIRK